MAVDVKMQGVENWLLTQGVLGVAVVLLIYTIMKLYSKVDQQQKDIIEIMQTRIAETKETTKEVTDVLRSNAQSMEVLSEKIEISKRSQGA